MAIFDLYSKRQKALEGQVPAVYRHDEIPHALRVQLTQIAQDAIGENMAGDYYFPAMEIAAEINRILCKEYGVQELVQGKGRNSIHAVFEFVREKASVEQCLDFIEVLIHVLCLKPAYEPKISRGEAIEEVNHRFKEHGIGFQLVNERIIKVGSELVHREMTLPALKLLEQNYLAGANQEFLSAHNHFRCGRKKESLNDCLKAFESTMKCICHKRKWPYNQTDTAKTLIKVCEDNSLFPVFMENHLTGLRMTLEAGVPTARNKISGHGQGAVPSEPSEEFVAYVLHLTAANIFFLASTEQKLK